MDAQEEGWYPPTKDGTGAANETGSPVLQELSVPCSSPGHCVLPMRNHGRATRPAEL